MFNSYPSKYKNKSKDTLAYKEIRKLFRKHFYPPVYTDYIKDGVSFKWYYDPKVKEKLKDYEEDFSKFFDELIPEDLYKSSELRIYGDYEIGPDWLEKVIPRDISPFSVYIRLLVRFEGA